jgi:hypothetical protein
MKRWLGLALLVFVATAGWRIGDALSPDALSMAVGVLFGVMAGVPTALLVMAGGRQRPAERRGEEPAQRERQASALSMNGWNAPYFPQQSPIILVAGPQGFGGQQPTPANASWLPQAPYERHFTVVGEREELVEDW